MSATQHRRTRLRRRLYLISAPFLALIIVLSVKMISVVVVGDAARSDFRDRDISALESDVAVLSLLDIIEPATTASAAGGLDVLAGRLPQAQQRFRDALAGTDPVASCPVRINLLLVQETLADQAFQAGRRDDSIGGYTDALTVAQGAPSNCFAGNDDPDEQRRAVRADAINRLERKLAFVSGPALAAPPPPPPPAAAPPPPAGSASAPEPAPEAEPPGRVLGGGDAQERLRRLLDNANSAGENRE